MPAPPPPGAAPQAAVQSGLRAARSPAGRAHARRGRSGARRTDQALRRCRRQAAGRSRPRRRRNRKKPGCEGGGFFSLFTGRSPQCGPLNAQIQQMRGNLDRMMSDLERLKSGSTDQEGQRRALIGAIGAEQLRAAIPRRGAAAARAASSTRCSAGTIINPGGDGAPSGTYRTVCVRTCDGYYFPISYSTVPSRFADDQRACQRDVPGGRSASSIPTAIRARTWSRRCRSAASPTPRCRTRSAIASEFTLDLLMPAAGPELGRRAEERRRQPRTLESGDIVVTDQNAKALSQPPQTRERQGRNARASAAERETPSHKTRRRATPIPPQHRTRRRRPSDRQARRMVPSERRSAVHRACSGRAQLLKT